MYVESVVTEESKTILVFSGDVTSELLDGDAITLDEATILLNGRGQTAWTETERYLVSKISGFYNFADEPDKIRMLWNRISFVDAAAGSGQAYETNKLSIPVGWADGVDTPVFTFVDGKGGEVAALKTVSVCVCLGQVLYMQPSRFPTGGWHRRNRLQTNQEIKAEATATLRICWAANDGGSQEPWQLTVTDSARQTLIGSPPFAAAFLCQCMLSSLDVPLQGSHERLGFGPPTWQQYPCDIRKTLHESTMLFGQWCYLRHSPGHRWMSDFRLIPTSTVERLGS